MSFKRGQEQFSGPQDYDISLASKYKNAMQLLDQLESGNVFPTSDEYKALHLECLNVLVECCACVEQLGVFSSNETWDDIQTPDIRYLNLNFYLGKVLEKTPINPSKMSVQARVNVLSLAVHRHFEFLYDIMSLKLTLRSETNPPAPLVPFVPMELILPRGKYGEFDLSRFNSRKNGRRVKQDNATRLRAAEKTFMASKLNMPVNDEESIRQVEADRLVLHWFATWDALYGITGELELLAASALAFDVPAASRNNYKEYVPASLLPEIVTKSSSGGGETFNDLRMRMDTKKDVDMSSRVENAANSLAGGKLVEKDGKVRRPFVIMPSGDVNRTKLAQSVFGTGQRMPTVTVEELVEKELANQAKPQIPESELARELREDSDDAADILTMKARRWDDFTEANPRGSGNTLNLG